MDKEGRGVRTGIVAVALTAAVLAAGAAGGQVVTDVLAIGTVSVSSGTGQVEVPIYIQDNTGTRIGRDQPAGHRISGFAAQVTYGFNACIDTPASPGQEIDKTGGILASQFADVDSRVKVANTSQSWIYSSAETNGLIPFTAAAAPGDRIGAMVFNLTGCPAGTINLVITTSGGAGAALSSDSGASETVGDGLSVVNGAINIGSSANTPTNTPTPTPSITPTGSQTPITATNTPTRTPTNPPLNSPTNTPVGATTPVINSVNPSSGTTRGGTLVTIIGNRFLPGVKVFFGDTPASSVDFSNPSVLFARTDAHAAATVDVIVTNADGGSARLVNAFRYDPLVEDRSPRPTPRVLDRPQT
jgi:IPT/TIG domain-containing protein